MCSWVQTDADQTAAEHSSGSSSGSSCCCERDLPSGPSLQVSTPKASVSWFPKGGLSPTVCAPAPSGRSVCCGWGSAMMVPDGSSGSLAQSHMHRHSRNRHMLFCANVNERLPKALAHLNLYGVSTHPCIAPGPREVLLASSCCMMLIVGRIRPCASAPMCTTTPARWLR